MSEFQFVSGELVACALNRPLKYGTKCQQLYNSTSWYFRISKL